MEIFYFGSRRRVASVFSPHPEHRRTVFKAGRGTVPARTVNRSGIVHVTLQHPIARRALPNQTRPNQTRNVANASRPAAPTSRVRSPHVPPPIAHTDRRLRRRTSPPDLIRRRSFRAKLARRRLFFLVLHDENQPHPLTCAGAGTRGSPRRRARRGTSPRAWSSVGRVEGGGERVTSSIAPGGNTNASVVGEKNLVPRVSGTGRDPRRGVPPSRVRFRSGPRAP